MRFFIISGLLLSLVSFEDSRSETLLKCMEKCVSYEGGNSDANKATCKPRCGSALIKKKLVGVRDCKGEVKACQSKCGWEKIGQLSPCHKECKALQMSCL